MKVKIFTLLTILISFLGFSQNTYVPDDNFEQALIDLGYDTVLDDYVTTSNINGVTDLDVSFQNITDLTGIEDFVALINLDCYTNNLTSVDLSQNTALQNLDLGSNQLTRLNVSQNTQLLSLLFDNNALQGIDVRLNTDLLRFYAQNNLLEYINIKNGNNNSIIEFYAQNNPDLTCIEVDNAAYSTTNWTSIDAQTSFSENCGYPETYVPDDNFEQALIDLGYDTVLDDYVITANINGVISLDVSNKNIANLTGIEGFTALTILNCGTNQLTSLDVSQNTALAEFSCASNELTSLDVTQNTALTVLWSQANALSSLDVSQNTALTELICWTNQLTTLNLKNGNNTNITNFNAIYNNDLFCIEVDDAAYSTTHWTFIDVQTSFSEDCSAVPLTYVPDDNFEQALIDLGYDTVLDDYVTTANISGIDNLNVFSKNIADLTGIEDFTALTILICSNNQLSNLDVTQNTNLTSLGCYLNQLSSLDVSQNTLLSNLNCNSNQLTSLDVTQNTALIYLTCGNNLLTSLDISQNSSLMYLTCDTNQLTSLDLSQNTALTELDCYVNSLSNLDVSLNSALTSLSCSENQLTSLNVKNGNNTNFTNFWANENPDLTCIEVDDAAYSTANWTNIDAQTSFSEDCSLAQTYVPDDNFEQALIDLGYDTVLDDYVTTANISGVIGLNVASKNIDDLTGIEDFAALTSLNCKTNYLTNLDLTQNTALTQLDCRTNQLSNLDLTQNTLLEHLDAYNNLLTSLDVSQNTALTLLSCGTNQITGIDITQNTALTQLYVENNLLTSLDLSQNVALTHLFCYSNQLTSLNVKNTNNTNVISFLAYTNPDLYCIEVDDAAYSTANWTDIDAQTTFNEDCGTLSITDSQFINEIVIYPNPVQESFAISSQQIGSYVLMTIKGQQVKNGSILNGNTNVDISALAQGIYFIKIKTTTGILTKKIIKF